MEDVDVPSKQVNDISGFHRSKCACMPQAPLFEGLHTYIYIYVYTYFYVYIYIYIYMYMYIFMKFQNPRQWYSQVWVFGDMEAIYATCEGYILACQTPYLQNPCLDLRVSRKRLRACSDQGARGTQEMHHVCLFEIASDVFLLFDWGSDSYCRLWYIDPEDHTNQVCLPF